MVCILAMHNNKFSLLSSPLQNRTSCLRGPSAITAQAECFYWMHKGSHSVGFTFAFPPSHPHTKGIHFNYQQCYFPLLDLSTPSPKGATVGERKIKDTRWMLGESVRLVANMPLCANPTVVKCCLFLVTTDRRKETDTRAWIDLSAWFSGLLLHAIQGFK